MAGTARRQGAARPQLRIVDEVDSILIDEARTPLIICGRVADAAKLYYRFASVVRSLQRDVDYEVEEDKRVVVPLEAGIEKVERALGIENLYDEVQQNLVHQMSVALKAKELYKRDKDYIVQSGEVKIVDEFTGRILEGRRWSEGIHQAVEAKEGVKIKEENQTLATITLQNYFRMYDKLAGMTGTAQTEAAELMNTYEPRRRADPDQQPERPHRPGRPHLQERGRQVRRGHRRHRRAVRARPAGPRRHGQRREERAPVAHARASAASRTRCSTPSSTPVRRRSSPRPVACSAVTVATNMAGRGVDILLGGNPEGLARHEVLKEGFAPEVLVDDFALPCRSPDAEEFQEARARALARYDELLAEFKEQCTAEGDQVRELGGLYVIGSERHESRRIDNQLRGRSGRQGDPGESRFYLSLDDELMRLFATGALQLGDGPGAARRRGDRGEDGHQGHRAGADHRRDSATPRSARTSSSTTR